MTIKFISVNEAILRYEISQNKVRKVIKDAKGTEHVKQAKIKGKHGFKYLISVDYLDTMFNPVNEVRTNQKQGKNEVETDNQLVIQLKTENNRLSNQIDKQNETIKELTTTLQEQQKIVIAQSLQISRLSEPKGFTPGEKITPGKTYNFESIIIVILVCCIVAVLVFLFT